MFSAFNLTAFYYIYSLSGLINCVAMLVSKRHVNERLKTSGEVNESFAQHFQYVSIHKGAKLQLYLKETTFLMTSTEVKREVIEI